MQWVYWEKKNLLGHGYITTNKIVKVVNCPLDQSLEGKKINADIIVVICNSCYAKNCVCGELSPSAYDETTV